MLFGYYHALEIDGATRWFEWNSERIIDTNPIQKIGYLPNLNASPTSDSVVMKTLQMAIDIADECPRKYIVLTYDLAIACVQNSNGNGTSIRSNVHCAWILSHRTILL